MSNKLYGVVALVKIYFIKDNSIDVQFFRGAIAPQKVFKAVHKNNTRISLVWKTVTAEWKKNSKCLKTNKQGIAVFNTICIWISYDDMTINI